MIDLLDILVQQASGAQIRALLARYASHLRRAARICQAKKLWAQSLEIANIVASIELLDHHIEHNFAEISKNVKIARVRRDLFSCISGINRINNLIESVDNGDCQNLNMIGYINVLKRISQKSAGICQICSKLTQKSHFDSTELSESSLVGQEFLSIQGERHTLRCVVAERQKSIDVIEFSSEGTCVLSSLQKDAQLGVKVEKSQRVASTEKFENSSNVINQIYSRWQDVVASRKLISYFVARGYSWLLYQICPSLLNDKRVVFASLANDKHSDVVAHFNREKLENDEDWRIAFLKAQRDTDFYYGRQRKKKASSVNEKAFDTPRLKRALSALLAFLKDLNIRPESVRICRPFFDELNYSAIGVILPTGVPHQVIARSKLDQTLLVPHHTIDDNFLQVEFDDQDRFIFANLHEETIALQKVVRAVAPEGPKVPGGASDPDENAGQEKPAGPKEPAPEQKAQVPTPPGLSSNLPENFDEYADGGSDVLDTIRFAGQNQLILSITYHKPDGSIKDYEIEPYSLRFKTNQHGGVISYLFAVDSLVGGIKSFIIENIQEAKPLPEKFEPQFIVEL